MTEHHVDGEPPSPMELCDLKTRIDQLTTKVDIIEKKFDAQQPPPLVLEPLQYDMFRGIAPTHEQQQKRVCCVAMFVMIVLCLILIPTILKATGRIQ